MRNNTSVLVHAYCMDYGGPVYELLFKCMKATQYMEKPRESEDVA